MATQLLGGLTGLEKKVIPRRIRSDVLQPQAFPAGTSHPCRHSWTFTKPAERRERRCFTRRAQANAKTFMLQGSIIQLSISTETPRRRIYFDEELHLFVPA